MLVVAELVEATLYYNDSRHPNELLVGVPDVVEPLFIPSVAGSQEPLGEDSHGNVSGVVREGVKIARMVRPRDIKGLLVPSPRGTSHMLQSS